MTGYLQNIEKLTMENPHFRQVLFTSEHLQLVVMSIKLGGDIGMEVHPETDQFIRIESGTGKVIMDGEERPVKDGDAFIIPAGVEHNVVNTSTDRALQLYTIYSPPHHRDGTIHHTKEDVVKDTEDHR